MKNAIASLIFVITTIVSLAQAQANKETSGHLTFKGVPIDGTLGEYTVKMEMSGFTQMSTEDGVSILQGDFASYKNCVVGVATLKQKDLVNRITVIFPEQDTWSGLSSNYFSLQEMLTEKYGKPADSEEQFDGLVPRDDNSKMHDVKMDRCKYYTTYETEKGSIQLSIEHDGFIRCYVQLSYYDKINGEIIRKNALGDL
jgi:hypothetical protein